MVEIKNQDFDENKKIFEREKNELLKNLGSNVSIEHVGSTAIPNMVGKNIIDILVGAKDEKEFDDFKIKIKKWGFIQVAEVPIIYINFSHQERRRPKRGMFIFILL